MGHYLANTRIEPPTTNGLVWPKEQTLPSPFRELYQEEYGYRKLHSGGIVGIGYDQLFLDNTHYGDAKGYLWSCHFEWYQHFGLMTASWYTSYKTMVAKQMLIDFNMATWIAEPKPNNYGYGFVVRYFKLGCEHHWQEITDQKAAELGCNYRRIDNFDHIYHCPVCNNFDMTNSSG